MYDISPEEFDRLDAIRNDGPVTWSRWIISLVGVVNVLVAISFLLTFLLKGVPEGTPAWYLWATRAAGPFGCCIWSVGGILAFSASSRLFDGKKLGWYLGVFFGALCIPSLCLPFGLLVVWALTRKKIRTLFRI